MLMGGWWDRVVPPGHPRPVSTPKLILTGQIDRAHTHASHPRINMASKIRTQTCGKNIIELLYSGFFHGFLSSSDPRPSWAASVDPSACLGRLVSVKLELGVRKHGPRNRSVRYKKTDFINAHPDLAEESVKLMDVIHQNRQNHCSLKR